MLIQLHLVLRDPPLQRRLRAALEGLDVAIEADPGTQDPLVCITSAHADVVVFREDLIPGRVQEVAAAFASREEPPAFIVLTRSQDPEHRSVLLGQGARAVAGERDRPSVLRAVLQEALTSCAADLVLRHRARQGSSGAALADFTSEAPSMRTFLDELRKVVRSDASLLIQGETGVGKERLALVIHREGPRKIGPFVAVNCAAIPENLLESVLFGHERGSFTGADQTRKGRFEMAHGGTLLLDEIGEMPLPLQSKLLRVLQEREVEPVGSERPVSVDIRVIAATNKDLKTQVAKGTFRADLYYRLAVFTLTIPPLRDRPEDVGPLIDRFLDDNATRTGRHLHIDPAARQSLVLHTWPGNVRELMNVLERATILAETDTIGLPELPETLTRSHPSAADSRPPVPSDLASVITALFPTEDSLFSVPWPEARARILTRVELWVLRRALHRTSGDLDATAALLGLTPTALQDRLTIYDLDLRTFQGSERGS
jgi:transcriptional regulator with GAF, ATPase, and Fis domain